MILVKIVGEKETLKRLEYPRVQIQKEAQRMGATTPNGLSGPLDTLPRYIHMTPKSLPKYTLQKQRLMQLDCAVISMTSFSCFRFKCTSVWMKEK